MTTMSIPCADHPTFADLLRELGDVPPNRVWLYPLPGTATEQDVLDIDDHQDRLCELIDGVLVEKAMGARESLLASVLIIAIGNFVYPRGLGIVLAPDGMLRLRPGLVRIPDVSFIARTALPGGKVPKDAIFALAPTLAVEVLSKSNPPGEMARKRREYFAAGTKCVWEFNPKSKSVKVFTSPTKSKTYTRHQTLDAAPVLKGLKIPLTPLFAQLD